MARATKNILPAALLSALGLLCAAEAAAQLICPPDTFLAKSRGRLICARGKAPNAPSAPQRPSSEAQPPRESEARTVTTTLSCAEFNAAFTAFHQNYALKFGGQARRNDQLIARLKIVIEQQKRLRDSLRGESLRARDIRVRRHLSSQANEAAQDIVSKERELAELKRQDAAQEARWKTDYKAKAAALLSKRPRGCPVAAAEHRPN